MITKVENLRSTQGDSLGPLTKAQGKEETYSDAYNLAYRGLSSLGAHANLFVLDSYLDDRNGSANLIRVRTRSTVPSSFREPNLQMSLLLTAVLTNEVFDSRRTPTAIAVEIIERFNDVYGANKPGRSET